MMQNTTEWGVSLFDKHYHGLPLNCFTLLETSDNRSGLLGISRFLAKGIQLNQTVALITFEEPEHVLTKLMQLGLNCHEMLYMERLFILSYKETFTRSLNMSNSYHSIFDEIKRLTHDQVERIAFLNTDLLFNLESTNLATLSATKLTRATKQSKTTVLAQYTRNEGDSHKRLQEACHSLIDCYISIHKSNTEKLAIEVKKYH